MGQGTAALGPDKAAEVVRHWAELGRMTRAHRRPPTISWENVEPLIDACKTVWRAQSEELRGLLEKSNSLLAPLVDPLLIDFDLHRWLAEQREEVYSDWLEWVVRQLPTTQDVFDVFDIQTAIGNVEVPQRFSTQREERVKLSDWESYKKLDLVIRSEGFLLLIEVKKTSPEDADVAKQEEYVAWAETQPEAHKQYILLANKGERPEYHKFRLWTYEDLCLRLRRKVGSLIQKQEMRITSAALVLAYVGVLEQSMLRLCSATARRAFNRQPVRTGRELAAYLES